MIPARVAHVPDGRGALVHGWVQFLSQWDWQWFATLTFRDYVYPDGESLEKQWRYFMAQMSRDAYGRRWYKKAKKGQGIIWTCASERQRRGVLHYHALFGNVGGMRRLTWMDHWNRLAGFAKITTVESKPSVNTYCAKYVIKGGRIDMGGPLGIARDQVGLPFNMSHLQRHSGEAIRQGSGRGGESYARHSSSLPPALSVLRAGKTC